MSWFSRWFQNPGSEIFSSKSKGDIVGRVTINGVSFFGDNIQVAGRNVIINGEVVMSVDKAESKLIVHVEEGVINSLRADGSVYCGEVTGNVDAGGSVDVKGTVGGSIDAGGSVNVVGNTGNIDAGGSVNVVGTVNGKMDAGGSIRVK